MASLSSATRHLNLPTGWAEVLSNQGGEINQSFQLLDATFPRRYHHFRRGNKLKAKMDHKRPAVTGPPSLRLFRRKNGNVVDMCAFFFIRLHDVGALDAAYC